MDKAKLQQLLAKDEHGLFLTTASVNQALTPDTRLEASFAEINAFIDTQGQEPSKQSSMKERMLAVRLEAIRSEAEKIEQLKPLDRHNLLALEEKKVVDVKSIDLDALGLGEEADIFTIRNIPEHIEQPDFVAKAKKCDDFQTFEPLFQQCHADLANGERKMLEFANEQQIFKGQFFLLRGIMVYVADIGEREVKNGRTNARTRLIYENGTESNMLLRSFSAELYKNGKRISVPVTQSLDTFKPNVENTDTQTGYIYVLRSLSTQPEIAKIKNLYKIGYSRGPVDQRIKNAEQDPTYLMAPVHTETSYRCYNLNPQKLEHLLHSFFDKARLNLEIKSQSGRLCEPKEWFIVPLEVLEKAIELVLSEELLNYEYNSDLQKITTK